MFHSVKSKVLITIFLFMSCSHAVAAINWYHGNVTRISFNGEGRFIVTMDNGALSGCKHGYVYFDKTMIGEWTLKAAYSMALASLTTGREFGVVIDKEKNGIGGYCYAENMVSDIK